MSNPNNQKPTLDEREKSSRTALRSVITILVFLITPPIVAVVWGAAVRYLFGE